MNVTYAFACLLVTDRDRSVDWYERLFGRPPTFLPHDREAVWQVAATASVYVLADPDRAGRSVVTLVVDDLDDTLAEIAGRGIKPGPIDEMPGAGRKSVIVDPDGNEVGLVQIGAADSG
jgi:predicted enzyme related to lactoylglutathione lyase